MSHQWFSDARLGPRRYFGELEIFACEGLIVIIDEREGENEGDYKTVTPTDMVERLHKMVVRYRNKNPAEMLPWQAAEYKFRVRQAADVYECVKEAREMGEPCDPKVMQFWAKHGRNGKRARIVTGLAPKDVWSENYRQSKLILPDGSPASAASSNAAYIETAQVGTVKMEPKPKSLTASMSLDI